MGSGGCWGGVHNPDPLRAQVCSTVYTVLHMARKTKGHFQLASQGFFLPQSIKIWEGLLHQSLHICGTQTTQSIAWSSSIMATQAKLSPSSSSSSSIWLSYLFKSLYVALLCCLSILVIQFLERSSLPPPPQFLVNKTKGCHWPRAQVDGRRERLQGGLGPAGGPPGPHRHPLQSGIEVWFH